MVGRIAGELEQMDALSRGFASGSEEVQALVARLDGITTATVGSGWEGRSARRFLELWTSEFEPALIRLDAALGEAAAEVTSRKHRLLAADQ